MKHVLLFVCLFDPHPYPHVAISADKLPFYIFWQYCILVAMPTGEKERETEIETHIALRGAERL